MPNTCRPTASSADELVTAARAATGRHELAALTLSAYDPDSRVRNAALAVLDALAPGIP